MKNIPPYETILPEFDCHFLVDNIKFYNYWLALDHSKFTNQFAYYKQPKDFVDSVLSVSISDILDKNLKSKDLIKQKIKFIRDKYEKIRLWYTGGTDSHCLLTYAEELGIEYDEYLIQVYSCNNNAYVNEDYLDPIEYCKSKHDNVVISSPSVDDYALYNDMYFYKKYPAGNCHLSINANHPLLTLKNKLKSGYINITGVDKPHIYISPKTNKYYWVRTNSGTQEYLGANFLHFFEDHQIPEMLVKQVYDTVQYIKNYQPDFKGYWSMDDNHISYEHSLSFCKITGRDIPLNETLLSKKLSGGHVIGNNKKQQRCKQEIIDIGKTDIISKHQTIVKNCMQVYKDISNGIHIVNDHNFSQVSRIAHIFEITPTQLIEIDDHNFARL